ncbi:SDR family NAD(P)-dependent oxidoreductase [Fimbriimonas ginsengisoli]|uniref:Short-chain dehydrogenase/reductase SDR n=1 Tax=Fimbriimonas ginsengisoli Gsoil 348 TaxID=661478 RepID=A0A068NZ53_FIMGI|nr:SDR family oxidoreductase [Fimbriimonas ginsengisoli]AIE87974.1 short-chain dehydrogenase/reductase SDR [Fimbriimonas ginsengisoli Gsoil 348]
MNRKRVLVTGSSRGIGRGIATRLAADGWAVALHYTAHREEAEKTAEAIQAIGVYQADLSDPANAQRLFDAVVADGELHAVVNNAGAYIQQSFLAEEEDFSREYRRLMALNLESPVRLMRAAGKLFASRGGGKILNVASRVGFKGEAMASIYAASKAGLINFTRSLAVELAPQNVGVFGIAPAWTDTVMAREGMDKRQSEVLATLPLGRMATPADCAACASFLLSDDAAYLSGVTIDINGASYFH